MTSFLNFDSSALSRLLTVLAVGANQPFFTAEEWAVRLQETPEAQAFSVQLQREWYPVTVPDALCQQMMDFAHDYLMPNEGWPHIWAHILRVTGAALALAPEAGVALNHAFMLGIFHDLGKLDEIISGQAHELVGADLLRATLNDHYPAQEIAHMANAIAKKASPRNPYMQLLFDADKLDKIGATGIARRVSISTGADHFVVTLLRVKQDAVNFPEMHFPASRQLADIKLDFTRQFFETLGFPYWPNTLSQT